MRCEVGVHTSNITFTMAEGLWADLRKQMPAKPGFRSWQVMQRDGGLHFSRTKFLGCTPSTVKSNNKYGFVRMHFGAETIVRSAVSLRELEIINPTRFVVQMPPHHLWPWIKEHGHHTIPPEQWRWRLVQELNARIHSATEHHVDMPANLPEWVRRMLTQEETDQVYRNEELLR